AISNTIVRDRIPVIVSKDKKSTLHYIKSLAKSLVKYGNYKTIDALEYNDNRIVIGGKNEGVTKDDSINSDSVARGDSVVSDDSITKCDSVNSDSINSDSINSDDSVDKVDSITNYNPILVLQLSCI